jgi:hypothetical protein
VSKWTRLGPPAELQRVSFNVTMSEHPELAKWLWSLPYRGSSGIIRNVLSRVVQEARNTPQGRKPVIEIDLNLLCADSSHPTPTNSHVESAAPVAPATELSDDALSDEVAAIYADMEKEF